MSNGKAPSYLILCLCAVLVSMLTLRGCEAEEKKPEWKQQFDAASSYQQPSDKELRMHLTGLQYRVTQHDKTERSFQNRFWNNKDAGIYLDVVSGEALFSSTAKFKSGTGWPSFYEPLVAAHVLEISDDTYGMRRVEVRSAHANSHLGHLFQDGPQPTGLRYCINSASLRFVPVSELKKEGLERYIPLFAKTSKTSSSSSSSSSSLDK